MVSTLLMQMAAKMAVSHLGLLLLEMERLFRRPHCWQGVLPGVAGDDRVIRLLSAPSLHKHSTTAAMTLSGCSSSHLRQMRELSSVH